ncbi:amphi-Trp domain-containing protein [Desulfovibrio gilichinskyi]|uniref:Amphi-Trp domain-containing protein n=1 Tax=Desulfovibrio gilichinskyi TaxID=1519643 RepID=A0A1X7DLU9_9BACT|nr:amphi-Trp domain-containing protein [Desulfovibrio gilichinskyi]SMF17753.1 amphi-Trp domain-containing protein [Desulfovibrio gilichinskyi]
MTAEKKFLFESLQDSETIGNFLKSLIEGFESGKINLSTNGDEIQLSPHGLLNFAVKAKTKGESNKITIKIEWKETEPSEEASTKTLNINS